MDNHTDRGSEFKNAGKDINKKIFDLVMVYQLYPGDLMIFINIMEVFLIPVSYLKTNNITVGSKIYTNTILIQIIRYKKICSPFLHFSIVSS